jgi:hypothetical protein
MRTVFGAEAFHRSKTLRPMVLLPEHDSPVIQIISVKVPVVFIV